MRIFSLLVGSVVTGRLIAALFLFSIAFSAEALVPNVLKRSLYPTGTAPQTGAGAGASVAVDGDLTVVGAPLDGAKGYFVGRVKIYDTTTGQLLHILENPSGTESEYFGQAVAISGTKVVVGVPWKKTSLQPNSFRTGIAYIYDLGGPTPTIPIFTLVNSDITGAFGGAVAIWGDRVAVGAENGSVTIGNQVFSDAGWVCVYDLASASPEIPSHKIYNPEPASLARFGDSVAISGERLAVGASGAFVGGVAAGCAYVFDLSGGVPASLVATLPNPSPSSGDSFGSSAAIAGSRVVVGAPFHEAGRVFIFDLDTPTPSAPPIELLEPIPGVSDAFGFCVAIEGSKVVVGAHGHDVPATNAGRAFLYDLASAAPELPVAVLVKPAMTANDEFGRSVGISGHRIVVGAPGDDSGGEDVGSAFVFDLGDATLATPAVVLHDAGTPAGDEYGWAVALSGTRLAVGARSDDSGADSAGSVSVFDFSNPGVAPLVATIANPSPAKDDYFGRAVAISGMRVVVGASGDDEGGTDAGLAYVFDLSSQTPHIPILILRKPTPVVGHRFGTSVAIFGSRVVVGAPGRAVSPSVAASSVYVFDLASSTPTLPVLTLTNPNGSNDDHFGEAVALSGSRLVVGGYPAFSTTTYGRVYVYDLDSATPATRIASFQNPEPPVHPSDYQEFGRFVAIDGTRIVVADHRHDVGARDAGRAYVYDLASTQPTVPILTLPNPSPAIEDIFGISVAISGSRVLVGASGKDNSAPVAGAAYLFDLNSANPQVPVTTFNGPDIAPNRHWGGAVAINGIAIVIGASGDSVTGTSRGAVHLYGLADGDADGLPDAWEVAVAGSIVAQTAADDLDGDGLDALEELAYNRDPNVPDAAFAPTVVVEGGYLTMTLTKQPGAAYEVQSAGTLLDGQLDFFSAATTTALIDNGLTLKVRDNVLFGTQPARFLRVKVTAFP
jgi:hypothetical protein